MNANKLSHCHRNTDVSKFKAVHEYSDRSRARSRAKIYGCTSENISVLDYSETNMKHCPAWRVDISCH